MHRTLGVAKGTTCESPFDAEGDQQLLVLVFGVHRT